MARQYFPFLTTLCVLFMLYSVVFTCNMHIMHHIYIYIMNARAPPSTYFTILPASEPIVVINAPNDRWKGYKFMFFFTQNMNVMSNTQQLFKISFVQSSSYCWFTRFLCIGSLFRHVRICEHIEFKEKFNFTHNKTKKWCAIADFASSSKIFKFKKYR